MPVEAKVVRGKVRTVEAGSKHIAMTKLGHAVDGGGWKKNRGGWSTARRQADHINEAMEDSA